MFVLTAPQQAGSLIKKLSHTRIQVSLAASCDLTVDNEKREASPRQGGQHQEGVEALVLAHGWSIPRHHAHRGVASTITLTQLSLA